MIFLSSSSLSFVKIKWKKYVLEHIKMKNNCSTKSFEDLNDKQIKGLILIRVELFSFTWGGQMPTLHQGIQGGMEDPYFLLQKEGNIEVNGMLMYVKMGTGESCVTVVFGIL